MSFNGVDELKHARLYGCVERSHFDGLIDPVANISGDDRLFGKALEFFRYRQGHHPGFVKAQPSPGIQYVVEFGRRERRLAENQRASKILKYLLGVEDALFQIHMICRIKRINGIEPLGRMSGR